MIYDKDWHEVTDTSKGEVEEQIQTLFAAYTITDEGEGEYVTVKEYDSGGKDVEWQWTREPKGEWHFYTEEKEWKNPPIPDVEEWWSTDGDEAYACQVRWNLYTPYTEEELAEIQAEQEQAEQEQAEAEARAELMDSLPDAVADLSEYVSTNTASAEELADAVAELSQLVSDLVSANE